MPPHDRRSGSIAPVAGGIAMPLPRRFSLRTIKRRSKSRMHDPDLTHHSSTPSIAAAHLLPKRPTMRAHPTTPIPAPLHLPAPAAPRPRRMAFFREQGVMRERERNTPAHVDPLALLANMPVCAEGWLYVAVHAAPGLAHGPITKWMFRRNVVKRFAQVRGSTVLLYLNKSDPIKEIFSPVGCAVSSADTVVNRRGAVEHNVNIAKNGYTIQLRLKSEADADHWATVLRQISLVRQPRLSDFHLIAPIGEGASGKVFLVRDLKTGRKLALKCMSKKGGSFGYSASDYAAAEILDEVGYGPSCDLWALGTFLYHIMIGRPPRVAQSLQEARDNIFSSKEPIIWYSDVMSEQAMSLVTALIEIDPKRRLGCGAQGIAEVCAHPFFKDVDWMALSKGEVPPAVTDVLPPPEMGDLRNFNQDEWRSIRMDEDQDCPAYTESVLWPLRNLAHNPLPRDFLVSYSYSCETAGTAVSLNSLSRNLTTS
ncbi:unnamed protein product [Agarophyton chilense]